MTLASCCTWYSIIVGDTKNYNKIPVCDPIYDIALCNKHCNMSIIHRMCIGAACVIGQGKSVNAPCCY